jgi:hypothetical protein
MNYDDRDSLAKILIAVVRQGSPELAEGLTTNGKSLMKLLRQLPFALSLSKGAPSICARPDHVKQGEN